MRKEMDDSLRTVREGKSEIQLPSSDWWSCNKKPLYDAFVSSIGSTLGSMGVACAFGAAVAASDESTLATVGYAAGYMLPSFAVNQLWTSSIISSERKKEDLQTYKEFFAKWKSQKASHKARLPKGVRKLIDQIESEIDGTFNRMDPAVTNRINLEDKGHFSQDVQNKIQSALKVHADLLAHPTETLNVAGFQEGAHQDLEKLNAKAIEIVESLAIDRHVAESFVAAIRRNSIQGMPAKRAQIFLHGQPGTGKSEFVRTLHKLFGIPVCVMNMKDSGLDKMLGTFGFETIPDVDKTDSDLYGEIYKCFMETNVLNPIMFFDEIGDLFKVIEENGAELDYVGVKPYELKTFFDPDRETMSIFKGKYDIDISRVTFVLAGNHKWEEAAFRSRVPTIEFERFEAQKKSDILNQKINSEIERVLKLYDNNENIANIVAAALNEALPIVLRTEEQIVGLRVGLQMIPRISNYAAYEYLVNERDGSSENLQKFIHGLYGPYVSNE